MEFDIYNLPDEILVIILEIPLQDSLKYIKTLLLLDKKINHIVTEIINKKNIIDNRAESIYKKHIGSLVDKNFPQHDLLRVIENRKFVVISIVPGYFLHGLSKKINLATNHTETMLFKKGKLVSHMFVKVMQCLNEQTGKKKIKRHVIKKVEFYPDLKFETFGENGITTKIVTASYAKILIDDTFKYISKKENFEEYQGCLNEEMNEYNDIQKWIADYKKKTVE